MNFQHVKTFCTIALEGSFSRAADVLHLTQPTISAQIQALEKSVGARLFERSAKGIALTSAGEVFHEHALQLMELVSRTEEAMDQLQGLERGRLDLGASTVPGHYLLPAALAGFKETAPKIKLNLAVANSREIRAGVRDGLYELGIVGEKVRDPRLAFDPIVRDHLIAIVRPAHPLATRQSLTVQDLLDQPMVAREYGSGTRATLQQALEKAGADPARLQFLLELGSNEAVKMAVRSTDAVAVLSEWCVQDDVRNGLLCGLPVEDLDLARYFWLVWRASGYLSVASQGFIKFLRQHLAGMPSLSCDLATAV